MAKKKTTRKPAARKTTARKPRRTVKKTARKKAPARKVTKKVARKTVKKTAAGVPEISLKVSKKVATKNVKFKTADSRGTQYQPLFDEMAKLKKGETLPVDVPKGITARVLHNRLNSVFRRFKPKAPAGCKFVKRTLEDGRIGITCEGK